MTIHSRYVIIRYPLKEVIKTAQTKPEIRMAWNKENMRNYGVTVHKEHEKHIIDFVDKKQEQGYSISAIFKQGIEELIEKEK